jgi:predicted ATP-grasp superfamily ATP-dependent carboligase
MLKLSEPLHNESVRPSLTPLDGRTDSLVARPRSVLVAGIVPTLTWAVARSLSLAGHRVVVLGWQARSPMALVPSLPYVPWRKARGWEGGELGPDALEAIDRTASERGLDWVVPADYPTTAWLSEHGAALRTARLVPVPQRALMDRLHDKWQFASQLDALRLPRPHTELARTADELLATRLAFPIITKPVDRWASLGFQRHDTPDQLRARLETGSLTAPFPVLVQSFAPGTDVGVAFVARRGKVLRQLAFDKPGRGLRRHFALPRLDEAVHALVRATGYEGVGEIDARYDATRDDLRILELNPRFWASMLYATRAGANFADFLLRADELAPCSRLPVTSEPVALGPLERAVTLAVQTTERFSATWR